jgi:hypothetical protein
MKDLRNDLGDLGRALERIPSRGGGRSVMIMGARQGEGVSSVAASLAMLLSARSSRSTWLVDLNLMSNGQFNAFQKREFGRAGTPGRALDASLNQPPFYNVVPQLRTSNGQPKGQAKLLGAHQIENTKLFVTRFRSEYVKPGQKVQLRPNGEYWTALRRVSDWAVLDAPSIDVSRAGLAICRHVDAVVCVIKADKTRVDEINVLRDEIETHGGTCAGIVMNELKADARLADRFSG